MEKGRDLMLRSSASLAGVAQSGGRAGAQHRAGTGTGIIRWKENGPFEGTNVC